MSEVNRPDDWVSYQLGELGEITTGATPSTTRTDYYGGQTPFIGPSDLGVRHWINTYSTTLSIIGVNNTRVARKNDVLVSCIGNLGKVSQASETLGFNQQINCISCREGKFVNLWFNIHMFHFF